MHASFFMFLLFCVSISAAARGVTSQPTVFMDIDGESISSEHIDAEISYVNDQLETLPKEEKAKTIRAIRKEALKQIIERKSMVSHLKHSPKTQKSFISELNKCSALMKKASGVQSYRGIKKCEENMIRSHFHYLKMYQFILTDGDIRRNFKKNKHLYKTPRKIKIRHILFATSKRAKSLYRKLKPSNFASYAEMYSIAAEANSGGLMGPFAKGSVPDVFNQCFELPTKGISKIIRSEYGFHVFMVVKKYPAHQQSFKEVSFKIEKKMRDQMSAQAYQDLLAVAVKQAAKTDKSISLK